MNPLLILGLDGATFDIIDAHSDRVPTISALIESGYAADLRSTQPASTSVAWPAFVTGQNPARFGMFDFLNCDPSSFEFSINDVREREFDFFWDYLDSEVGIASAPMVPYRGVDGFFIQGSLARINADRITKPVSLGDRIPPAYDNHIDPATDTDEIVADTFDRIDARERVFEDLVTEYDLDIYFFMFSVIDHIQHHFWAYHDDSHPAHEPSEYDDVILRVYERVDEALGRLLSHFDDPNVVIASDHGFGPKRVEVNLNALLASEGYLSYSDDVQTSVANSVWSLKSVLKRTPIYGLVPDFVKSSVKSSLPSHNDIDDVVDWAGTKAYSFGAGGNVYLNLAGRERDGIVPGGEYESVRDELLDFFATIEDPETNERVIESARPREAVYEGPHLDRAPDIVLRPRPGYHLNALLGRAPFSRQTQPMPNSGMHMPAGVFIANGPDFESGVRGDAQSITDVAPTLLHLLEGQVPNAMDGEPVVEALADQTSPVRADFQITERNHIRRRVLMLKQLDVI
jgi:predicted AlkP superfamily phosphohydrolase/phosphomutase